MHAKAAAGVTAGGVYAIAKDSLRGAQFGGVFAYAGQGMRGFQLAPLTIIRGGSSSGVQMGLFNWNGAPDALVQIGLINVSRGAATVPIGLINSVSGGIFNPALFLDDMEFLNLSLRSGSKNFYTVLVCGIRQIDFGARTWYIINNQKDDYLITGRGGFGFEFGISKRFFLDADGLCGGIFDIHKPLRGDGGESGLEGVPVTLMAQLRLAAGFRLWEHLAAFGGISYNYFYRGNQNAPLPQEHMTLHIFSPNALGHIQRIGFFAGIQF